MRYVDSLGNIQTATNEQMRELDEKEGRVRVPSAVIDATIGMMGAALLVEKDGEILEKTLKRFGLWRDTRLAQTMLDKVVKQLQAKISTRQALSIRENCRGLNVQCSARPAEMCVNLPVSACDVLVNHALHYCQHHCLKGTQEARKCPLRDVFASVPGMDYQDDGIGICPFMGVDRIENE